MKKVFDDPAMQERFEKALALYETVRLVIAAKVDMSNPTEVINQLSAIQGVQASASQAKAMFTYLTDKFTARKLSMLDMESKGAMEKKAILNSEVGDVSFWNEVSELNLKQMSYQIEILRSALSYLKSEMQNLNN
jgi:hypothetical protein